MIDVLSGENKNGEDRTVVQEDNNYYVMSPTHDGWYQIDEYDKNGNCLCTYYEK